jgi:hypothetical protein
MMSLSNRCLQKLASIIIINEEDDPSLRSQHFVPEHYELFSVWENAIASSVQAH